MVEFLLHRTGSDELLPLLPRIVWYGFLPQLLKREAVVAHGALLARDGSGIVVCGPSGAGEKHLRPADSAAVAGALRRCSADFERRRSVILRSRCRPGAGSFPGSCTVRIGETVRLSGFTGCAIRTGSG